MPTVVITGANRGLGLALVRAYAGAGWRVHAGCRMPDKASDLKQVEGEVEIHRLDVTDGLHVSGLARALAAEPVDLLFNNAGISGPRGALGEIDEEAWQKVFAVNTVAPLRVAKAFAGHLGQSERGLIVNVSSAMGSIAENSSSGAHFYRASKAALNMLTRCLSIDLAEQVVAVVAVHPGWVCTRMGGSEAPIEPADSASALMRLVAGLGAEHSGRFFAYDGREIPW